LRFDAEKDTLRCVNAWWMAGMLLLLLPPATGPMSSAAGKKIDKKAAVDAAFEEFQGEVPGAGVAVIRDGKVVLQRAYGMAELEVKRRAGSRTSYRLASVSKQFTAAAILLLVERGKLTLDDPLTHFFPGFPDYGRQIRVRHLLAHTSGLLAYEDLLPSGTTTPVLDADVLAILKRQDHTYFPPGTQFRYSNSGYALLACIVEKVSEMPFATFLTQNIFRPLGMRETFLNLRDRPVRSQRRAYGYSQREKGFERTDQSRTSYVLGDGGIYSSTADLAKWERSLLSMRLLPAAKLEMAMSEQATTARPGVGYGFGWYVGKHGEHKAVWHEGSSIGFRNFYLRIPEKKLAVIVLTNRNEADAGGLAKKIADLFLRHGNLPSE
jgi:CubicO group peptidase (beta-lactamase class C family)